jgi:GNAT superfamily N-acetyltransferase
MELKVNKVPLAEVLAFRNLFLHENQFQFIHNKCHDYGWADTYAFFSDRIKIGYGSVWGSNDRKARDSIFEFYLLPSYRKYAANLFSRLQSASGVIYIESQSNDSFLSSMLYEFAEDIITEAILFEDHYQSELHIPGVKFGRLKTENKNPADQDGYYLQLDNKIVATGGFLTNYNPPYADIYMDVMKGFQRQGYGSLIVQELKKEIYMQGLVPAARCNYNNPASKSTLLKAGFKICGFLLKGNCRNNET